LKDHIDNCKLNEVFQRTKLLQPSKSHIKTKWTKKTQEKKYFKKINV
jgi:hypothetical protein